MTNESQIQSTEELSEMLKRIRFAPSCVNFDWRWEVEEVWGPNGAKDRVRGWLLNTTFQRPDIESGSMERGRGRQEFLRHGITESGVAKTCFLLAELIVRHEVMEAFHVEIYEESVKIFNPHHSIQDLALSHLLTKGDLEERLEMAATAVGIELTDQVTEQLGYIREEATEQVRKAADKAPAWEEDGVPFDPKYHKRLEPGDDDYEEDGAYNIMVKPVFNGTTYYDDDKRYQCSGCDLLFMMQEHDCDKCDGCHEAHEQNGYNCEGDEIEEDE